MGIKQSTLDAIKAAPLSKVVEALGGTTKRVGREFVTQCLWHEDENPSLTISDDKGFCFCHVCRGSGDAIDYTMRRKDLAWREAVEECAGILGIRVDKENVDPEKERIRREKRNAELSKNADDQDQYYAFLRDTRAGRIRQQLKDRGITQAAAKEFGLGFSPQGFFAGRVTIPIHDHRNQLVGWTGRATKEDQGAKYKNSPDSDLFQKKQLVFNEARAKEAARESGALIFVEGHLDVVSMWQAGIKNVVAMQGTAAPDAQVLQRLSRSIKNFILCYDGDAGGRKAVEQFISVAGPMAMKGEISVTVVNLPEGRDPDDVIRSGEDLYSYIAAAPPWLDWVIDVWTKDLDLEDTSMITTVEDRLRNLISGLRSRALRAHYIDKAARVLTATSKEAEKLAKEWGNRTFVANTSDWAPRTPQETRTAVERRMVRMYIHCPEMREKLSPWMGRVQNPPVRWLCNRLEELEQYSAVDLTPHSVMAVVAVAEPHFMQQLRSLIRPNVYVETSDAVVDHICDIMCEDLPLDTNESDSN